MKKQSMLTPISWYDTICMIHVQTINDIHSENGIIKYTPADICQQNISSEGKFLKTFWPCIENKCSFINTKLVDEMEDSKQECCE